MVFQFESERACIYSGKRVFRIDKVAVKIGRISVDGLGEVDRTRKARRACIQAFSCVCTVQLLLRRIEACGFPSVRWR